VSKVPLFPYMPTDLNDVYQPENFLHRLFSFYENFAELLLMNYFVENFLMSNIAKFGVPDFTWHELYKRSSLLFTDSIDRLWWPLSIGNEQIGVGSHCNRANGLALSSELKEFIEDPNSKGTILIALGTYPDWHFAPIQIKNSIFGVINTFDDYRVIFVYNGPSVDVKEHIKLVNWTQQPEILVHPKTLAFVTHSGMKSIKEGICGPTPLIVMPMFAEQAHNAHFMISMGYAKAINKYSLTEDSVYKTIYDVVSDPESMKRAVRLKEIFLDRMIPAVDEGVFHIEKLLRLPSGRRPNFTRQGVHLYWAQFLYFELVLVLIALIIMIKR